MTPLALLLVPAAFTSAYVVACVVPNWASWVAFAVLAVGGSLAAMIAILSGYFAVGALGPLLMSILMPVFCGSLGGLAVRAITLNRRGLTLTGMAIAIVVGFSVTAALSVWLVPVVLTWLAG